MKSGYSLKLFGSDTFQSVPCTDNVVRIATGL